MITPLSTGIIVRERGNVVNQGDSISSGFGGVVPYILQATWWPDVNTVSNFALPGESVGPDTQLLAMITSGMLTQFDAAFNGAKDYNIGLLQGGLNDLNRGQTPAQTYSSMAIWNRGPDILGKNGRQSVGFKTILITPIKIDPSNPLFTDRAALRGLELANSAGFDAVVDADGIPGTPGDGINYDLTNGHLTNLGQGVLWSLIKPVWKSLVGL